MNTSRVSLLHRRSRLAPVAGFLIDACDVARDVSVGSVSLVLTRCLSMSLHPGTAKLTAYERRRKPYKLVEGCCGIRMQASFDELRTNGEFAILRSWQGSKAILHTAISLPCYCYGGPSRLSVRNDSSVRLRKNWSKSAFSCGVSSKPFMKGLFRG